MVKNRTLPKVAMALAIFVLSISYIQWKRQSGQGASSESITRLPRFSTVDISGRPVTSKEIRGRVLYVQFLKGFNTSDLGIFEGLYSTWEKERLFMAAITDSPNEVASRFSADHPNMVIIDRDYEAMKRLFRASASGMYYLFDASGMLVAAGRSDWQSSASLKSPLNRLLKNKVFEVSHLIPIGTRVQEHVWLGQIAEIIREEPHVYHVVAMFTRFCASCSSGLIMESLREFYSRSKGLASVTCILNNAFTNQDARNMSTQLGLPFDVIIAGKALSERWSWLIEEFSESDATDIILVIDRLGNILKASYPSCGKCWTQLMDYLNELTEAH